MKNLVTILISFVLGAAAMGGLFYFNYLPSKNPNLSESVVNTTDSTTIPEKLGASDDPNTEIEDNTKELEEKLAKETACRKASETMSEIEDECGMMPFPGVDECIQQRIDRAEVENKEENLSRANNMKSLHPKYLKLNADCK